MNNTRSITAKLQNFHFQGHSMELKVLVSGCTENEITGGILALEDARENIEIPMETSARTTANGIELTMKLTCTEETPLRPVRWFCCVLVQAESAPTRINVICDKPALLRRMRMRNIQCEHRDNMILVPYVGGGKAFKFTWRARTEYDTAAIRRREILASIIFKLIGPRLRKKQINIVYEKFCRTAQDNGYYFFRYCMENLQRQARSRFYYVIDKRSPDYQKLKSYDANVIDFMSLRHMLYAMAAKICISTDSAEHLYVWQPRPGFVIRKIGKKKVLFLQHGVLGLKRVEHLYGKNGFHPVEYFIVSSEYEKDIVVRDYEYPPEDVAVTGLARWDALENKEVPEDRFILINPTWRIWLEDVTDEEFAASEYFRWYAAFLRDPRLNAFLEERNLRAVMYLHPKFAGYIDTFREQLSDRITCVPFGEKPLNDLLMRCTMLITDYSSVCWDVLYQGKPVLFYEFDTDAYLKKHGSYIDLMTELPGPRAETTDEVFRYMKDLADLGFQIPDVYRDRIDRSFAFKDKENCRRIYEFLVEKEG